MIIGLDLDGVIYSWHDAVESFYREFKGYTGESYYFWTTYIPSRPNSEMEFICQINVLYSSKTPSKEQRQIPELLSKHHVIYYITSRPESARLTTEMYLRKHKFPFHENLIFTQDKATVARARKIDWFLDDNVKHVRDLSKVTRAVLFARPWNRDYWEKFRTIFSLREFYKMIGD